MSKLKKFLVISYDNDEQQWFYDTVFSHDAVEAECRITTVRPYVVAADAIELKDLRKMVKHIEKRTCARSGAALLGIAADSGVECDCADRSWYGDRHDTACVLSGLPNAGSLLNKKTLDQKENL